ncbi:MAG: hypothetical protein ACR2IQ_02685 [Minisyncoccia bacterium]
MKTLHKLFMSVVVVPLSLLCSPVTNQPQPTDVNITINDVSVKEMIKCVVPAFYHNPQEISTVVQMESGYNINAVHDGGSGKGITGFHKDTFDRWNKQSGLNLNYDSSMDQIKLMAWAFDQGKSYKDDWTTWQRLHKKGIY